MLAKNDHKHKRLSHTVKHRGINTFGRPGPNTRTLARYHYGCETYFLLYCILNDELAGNFGMSFTMLVFIMQEMIHIKQCSLLSDPVFVLYALYFRNKYCLNSNLGDLYSDHQVCIIVKSQHLVTKPLS